MLTLWRTLTYEKLKRVYVEGSIIDLGGSKNAEYHRYIKGTHTFTSVNIDQKNGFDLSFDLEKPFPVGDSAYDAVFCINVMEHIYNYHNLVGESFRILKSGGKVVYVIPFLIQFHPCPQDFWRYSSQSLQNISESHGYVDIVIEPVGKGVFTSSASLRHNVYKSSLIRMVSLWWNQLLDYLFVKVLKFTNYSEVYYPLGFIVTATKK